MKTVNQKGLTLVELLAVIAISSIILVVGYSILFSMIKSADHSAVQTKLRNESVLITQQVNQAMLNIDAVEAAGTTDADGKFKSFYAIDKAATDVDGNRAHDTTVFIQINADGNLLIDNKQVNSDGYSLKNTAFKEVNSNLQIYYVIDDLINHEQLTLFKIFPLKSE